MSEDPQNKKRTLDEISHLFLSDVRDRQTSGGPRPHRTPPRAPDHGVDLTPEEFAQVYGSAQGEPEPRRKLVPISAVVGGHLNGKQFDRVKQYARHLAAGAGRIGLIELDASELRLMCFDPAAPAGPGETDVQRLDCTEPRQIAEALEEMNWDVERWLLLLPNPRTPEARALLRQVDHWTLLSTSDHDGVVAGYRMLKGLVDDPRPRLTLSLLDADDPEQAGRVFEKLRGVCRQFLRWELEAEAPVQSADAVSEHLVLLYRPTRDKAQLAAGPQWAVVLEFLSAATTSETMTSAPTEPAASGPADDASHTVHPDAGPRNGRPAPVAKGTDSPTALPHQGAAPAEAITLALPMNAPALDCQEVIDLPGQDVSSGSILSAVLARLAGELVECPVRPPMCIESRLAVARDRAVVLVAVTRVGLGDLRAIAQAYRWLSENRELIAMALPQFAIDPRQSPRLRLLVDRSDLAADVLQPLLQSGNVSVQAYRKLRWGQRLGVFLEAA